MNRHKNSIGCPSANIYVCVQDKNPVHDAMVEQRGAQSYIHLFSWLR